MRRLDGRLHSGIPPELASEQSSALGFLKNHIESEATPLDFI
jgi:hypothetical protein